MAAGVQGGSDGFTCEPRDMPGHHSGIQSLRLDRCGGRVGPKTRCHGLTFIHSSACFVTNGETDHQYTGESKNFNIHARRNGDMPTSQWGEQCVP